MIDKEKEMYAIIKDFILERFGFYSQMVFKRRDFHPTLKLYTREMMNNTIFDLVLHMFGKHQQQEIRLETPKTWRDWIKKKHNHKKWMRLIIKRFPIKYNYHHYILNEYTTFPKLVLPPDFDERSKLIFYDYDIRDEENDESKET